MSKSTVNEAEAAIVGAGPVGLLLALYLDAHGVRTVVLEREPTTRWHPKGNTQHPRTMEYFRQVGVAEAIRDLGLPGDHPIDVAYFTRLSTFEIARFLVPSTDARRRIRIEAAVDDQFPEPTHRVNQMYLERFLMEEAGRRANIDLRFSTPARSFHQDDSGVTIEAGSETAPERWHAQYLIGCDGSRSTVRRALGVRYHDEDKLMEAFMLGRFTSVHMRIAGFDRLFSGDRRCWMYLTINADARAIIIALNGKDEFMMHIKTDPDAVVDESDVARWVERAIGTPTAVEIIAHQPWNSGTVLVGERFRDGRVLLAGDAVHLFTTHGGFGMNTGMGDAANLGWKLAGAIKGWGGDGLIDSYEIERKTIAVRNTNHVRRLAGEWRDVAISPVLEEDSPAGAAARREAAGSAFVVGNHFVRPEEVDSVGVILGLRYDESPLIVADAPPPPETIDEYIPSDIPGGRAPHLWLGCGHGTGDSLYDRIGNGFALLRVGPEAPDAAAFVAAAGDVACRSRW